ncbi:MAG: rRNA maturation RNase YbeY [Lachnospiraceae bacterium]|nr:rRNA maturation RNase YbeY [Lachnospiraceae bacterium]
MTYALEEEYTEGLDFDHKKLYQQAVDTVLDHLHCPYEACVSLLLTNDEEIKKINSETRHLAVATDVLSFPMNEFKEAGVFDQACEDQYTYDPDSGELLLGDIVLSTEHVLQNAAEFGHSVEREYAFLIVHSMLHLTGFDHIEESDRIRMETVQNDIMQILGISR